MNKKEVITYLSLVLLILFLVISFATTDAIISTLMASFGIITCAFIMHQFSKLNKQ